MVYTFVNKNLLIPQVLEADNLDTLLQKLLDQTYGRSNDYNKNVYIVSDEEIYFSKENELYCSKGYNIIKIKKNIPTIKNLENIISFQNNNTNNLGKNEDLSEMQLEIKTKKNDIKIIDNNKNNTTTMLKIENTEIKPSKEKKEKSKEELEILKLIEETMEIYQTEVRKIKDIEMKIKILDDNTKNLEKKKKEKMLTNFSKLKNDYHTFVSINKKKEKKIDFEIPYLFELKYSYFNDLIKDEQNKVLLEKIGNLNLDEILNQKYELNDESIFFANKYSEESKKLNVKFNYSWEDLELEVESSETNNSKLGL